MLEVTQEGQSGAQTQVSGARACPWPRSSACPLRAGHLPFSTTNASCRCSAWFSEGAAPCTEVWARCGAPAGAPVSLSPPGASSCC